MDTSCNHIPLSPCHADCHDPWLSCLRRQCKPELTLSSCAAASVMKWIWSSNTKSYCAAFLPLDPTDCSAFLI